MSLSKYNSSNEVFSFSRVVLNNSSQDQRPEPPDPSVPTMSIIAVTPQLQDNSTSTLHSASQEFIVFSLLSASVSLVVLVFTLMKNGSWMSLLLSQFSYKIGEEDLGEQKINEDEFVYISKKV